MPHYYIVIGPPGAGKTTKINSLQKHVACTIVSPDEIRDTENVTVAEAYQKAKKRIPELLLSGHNVILDATNAFPDRRMEMISIGKPYVDAVIGIWLNTPLEVCFQRHCKRMETETSNRYPKDHSQYKETIKKYCAALAANPPNLSEGFDEILEIKPP